MKTNYHNLSGFEASVVFVAVLGLGLIGWEIYATLPTPTQAAVTESFAIFDVRTPMNKLASAIDTVLDITQDNFDAFDVAFTQTFSYPEQVGEPVMHLAQSFGNYTDSLALNFQSNLRAQGNIGQISGSTFVHTNSTIAPTISEVDLPQPRIEKHSSYRYELPTIIKKFY